MTTSKAIEIWEKTQALAALERVGILEQADQRASTLSGGQQPRVAIARCLVQGAKIILIKAFNLLTTEKFVQF